MQTTTTTLAAAEPAPVLSPEHSEKVEIMRMRLTGHLTDLEIDPAHTLAKFDNAKKTFAEKRNAYLQIMDYVIKRKREQCVEGLNDAGWDEDGIKWYLAKFNVAGFINTHPRDLLALWADMKKARMFFKAKARK